MNGIDPDLARFAIRLEKADIPCMVVGSVAVAAYGRPRATIDIDLLMAARVDDAPRIASAFPETTYCTPPIDVLRREIARGIRGHICIIDIETSLQADL